jgi:hypothetical protein
MAVKLIFLIKSRLPQNKSNRMFLQKVASIRSNLFVKSFLNCSNNHRTYTVVVERYENPGAMKDGIDQRKRHLKSKHFQYKFVECSHNKKWGNVDLILTQYVEGFYLNI